MNSWDRNWRRRGSSWSAGQQFRGDKPGFRLPKTRTADSFVTGHGFSRAANAAPSKRALAPEGPYFRIGGDTAETSDYVVSWRSSHIAGSSRLDSLWR